MSKPRIWISNASPKQGEIVRVRALIEHRMESGFRQNADGSAIPRNIIHTFKAHLNDELLFSWFPETAISQNPYIEFTFIAFASGELLLTWEDDDGEIIQGSTELTLSA